MKRVSWEYVNELYRKVDVLILELEKETDSFEVLAITEEIESIHRLAAKLAELMDVKNAIF